MKHSILVLSIGVLAFFAGVKIGSLFPSSECLNGNVLFDGNRNYVCKDGKWK